MNRRFPTVGIPAGRSGWLDAADVVSVGAILLVSYRAVSEWQRTAAALARHRAETTVDLLITAMVQDMRAVQATVLANDVPDSADNAAAHRYNLIASAFARYPYPEAFFTWTDQPSQSPTFYSRSDRPPAWLPSHDTSNLFAVALTSDTEIGARLLDRIALDARAGRPYSTFDIELGQSQCQIVVRLTYGDAFRRHLKSVFGFVVDLGWVRDHYFADLAKQVTQISSGSSGVQLTVTDGRGRTVFGAADAGPHVVGDRQFPLIFFDPRLVAINWPDDLSRESWTAYASIAGDPAVVAANQGANRALAIAAMMAVFATLALLLAVQGARARANIEAMRSEFISTVTHELKTPLTAIQAIGETFASGRGVTPDISRNYGRFTVHEAKRLRRLIDNLLAFSRMTDFSNVYSFEPVLPHALVEQTLSDFASQLNYQEFDVRVDVPSTLPAVRADRRAMSLVLRNLVDNAIRYSGEQKRLSITGRPGNDSVIFSVIDHGVGIPAEEIPLVTRKFFAGRHADRGGSGLGLAIVDRIVRDHAGALSIESRVGEGTTVSIELPMARGDSDE